MTKILSGLRTLFLVHFVVGLVFGLLDLLIPVMFNLTPRVLWTSDDLISSPLIINPAGRY